MGEVGSESGILSFYKQRNDGVRTKMIKRVFSIAMRLLIYDRMIEMIFMDNHNVSPLFFSR